MEKVYCVHCGAALDVYARFCRNCGEKTLISPALIRLATEKDQQAITELYERTYQDVYHTVRSVIHDEDTALDILQDAYIKGFESLDQLNDPRSYLPWMKRIAVNRAKNELKRKKPMLFTDMENEDGDELPFQDEREEHLPDVVIDKQETTRLINEMLGTLSEEQRMVIGMFYYEQMSVKEIAAELGCSENTVKSRLNYGRKKIETQVLDLEKRGTKLYSLSPVLFLLLLFRNMAGQPTDIPAQQILSNIQGSVGAQTAAQIGSAAGQEAARTGAKAAGEAAKQSFLHTVAGKVVAGIAAVVLVGGAAVGAVQLTQNNSTQAEPVTEAAEIQPEPVEELSEEPTPQEEPAVITETPPEEVTPEEQPVVEEPEPEEPEEAAVPDWQIAYTAFLPELHESVAEIIEAEVDYSYANYGYSLQEGLPCEYALFDLSGDGIPEIVVKAFLRGIGWTRICVFSYDETGVYPVGVVYGSFNYDPEKSDAMGSLLISDEARSYEGYGNQYCYAYKMIDGEITGTPVYISVSPGEDTEKYLGEYADHTELDWYDVDDFDGTLPY